MPDASQKEVAKHIPFLIPYEDSTYLVDLVGSGISQAEDDSIQQNMRR